jgi:hypothetical protein
MAYDTGLEERLYELRREVFAEIMGFDNKPMFGGVGYLLNGNMCFGIYKDSLILRVGRPKDTELMKQPHIGPMNLTGKVMKGWVIAEPQAFSEDNELTRLCELAVKFVSMLPPK